MLVGIMCNAGWRVQVGLVGAFEWACSPEHPLMIEWTASKLYLDKPPKSEMVSVMKTRYNEFFNYQLADHEADNMLSGM